MDPITLIVTAIAAGAAAAGQETAQQAVKDAYAGLKSLLGRRFSRQPAVAEAVTQVETRPESAGRQAVLQEELAAAHAEQDGEVLRQAQALLDLIQRQGQRGDAYKAALTGSGAIAQGQGAAAAGQGGVAVAGNVYGGILLGGPAPGRTEANAATGMTPADEAASLRVQLDMRKRLLLALEGQRVLAGAAEAARLDVQIDQEKQEIKRLEQRLDEVQPLR